jgi:hypothetical protein
MAIDLAMLAASRSRSGWGRAASRIAPLRMAIDLMTPAAVRCICGVPVAGAL